MELTVILSDLWLSYPAPIVIGIVLATVVLEIMFASLMSIRDRIVEERAGAAAWWRLALLYSFGIPILVIGYPLDILYNLTAGSLMFKELPRRGEWTLTSRLQRLVNGPHGWRRDRARWICHNLVEPWDREHCRMQA